MIATVDQYRRCSRFEVATGWVYGTETVARPASSRTPRQAFEDAIRPALADGPCYVTFSGGRDSSAVLAVATDLARREGFDLPVPVTRAYPELPDTDESSWQRAVLDHLGLSEWIRLEFRDGESDLLGAAAREGLESRGLIFPPALQSHGAMFRHLRNGSLITGEGGDAVLGTHRGAPFMLLRAGRRPSRALLGDAAFAVLPGPVRRRRIAAMAEASVQRRWLRPDALRRHAARVASDESAEPLRYDEATWLVAARRSFATIVHNHVAVAAEYGIRAIDPLLDRGFVAALAQAGGAWGYSSRTSVMHALFADVLPPAVIARRTKAWFNHAHTGPATQEFARSWDGAGVDHDLVDAERLRAVWLSDQPTMATGLLLQSAWLASVGRSG